MRSATLPAQITTVEDKIAGNLTLSQLLLLLTPVLLGALVFATVSPMLHMTPYKLVIIGPITVLCGLSAIRIKGRIALLWGLVMLRYSLRPRYFVLNKNDVYLRDMPVKDSGPDQAEEAESMEHSHVSQPSLSIAEVVRLREIIAKRQVHFIRNKKGSLDVRVTKVK